MVIFRKKKSKLKNFRASHNWEIFEHRYFLELEFIDIMDSVGDFKRKRTISEEEAKKQGVYSKAYINQDGQLLRLDWVGFKPSEVYIEYRNNLPVSAFEFRTAYYLEGKKVEDEFLDSDWIYEYDEDDQLIKLTWHTYPNLDFKYGYYNKSFVYYSYEYDEQGLLRKHQRNEGLSVDGKPYSYEKRVIYDRQQSQILAKHSVSKVAWLPISKKRKVFLTFQFGGTLTRPIKPPVCSKCEKPLSFICVVELNKPLKNQSSLLSVPVFYCFGCLEYETTIEYQEMSQNGSSLEDNTNYEIFPPVKLQLGKSTNLEDEVDAFIKFGGIPDWIQDDGHPVCKNCGKLMMFVSQINSDESTVGTNQSLMFGDSGKLYTFVCCNVVTSIMQCY